MCLIKKVEIDHSKELMYQAFGHTKERARWLDEYVNRLLCCENLKLTEAIERILKDERLSDNEKIVALYVLGAKRESPVIALLCLTYQEKCNKNDPPIFS